MRSNFGVEGTGGARKRAEAPQREPPWRVATVAANPVDPAEPGKFERPADREVKIARSSRAMTILQGRYGGGTPVGRVAENAAGG